MRGSGAQENAPGLQCIVSKRKEITGTLQVWELKKKLIKCQGLEFNPLEHGVSILESLSFSFPNPSSEAPALV
jgi:hypothetical protein